MELSNDMSAGEKFAVALGCMDGRCCNARFDAVENLGYVFLDTITEPGMDGIMSRRSVGEMSLVLSDGSTEIFDTDAAFKNLRAKVAISLDKHGSDHMVIEGHDQCAGNPVSREDHIADLKAAAALVHGWGGIYANLTIDCIFVSRNSEGEWVGESVYQLPSAQSAEPTAAHEVGQFEEAA